MNSLAEAYPDVKEAVLFSETLEEAFPGFWDEFRTRGWAPRVAVDVFIKVINRRLTEPCRFETGPERCENCKLVIAALPQMSHPQFLRYMAAKLGAM